MVLPCLSFIFKLSFVYLIILGLYLFTHLLCICLFLVITSSSGFRYGSFAFTHIDYGLMTPHHRRDVVLRPIVRVCYLSVVVETDLLYDSEVQPDITAANDRRKIISLGCEDQKTTSKHQALRFVQQMLGERSCPWDSD